MDEEDELALLNYKTPKGKIIKLLEEKIKKPEIDDSLQKILDQYNDITNKETPLLDNGVLQHLNFAEDALVVQACGQYYGKRVDKLWDELLQLHTRMVKYDEVTAKNCTDRKKQEERKQELARLEERLNRGKRKKITLSQPDEQLPPTNGQRMIDFRMDSDDRVEIFSKCTWERHERIGAARDKEDLDWNTPFDFNDEVFEVPSVPFEDDDVGEVWSAIHADRQIELARNYNSVILVQYHRMRNRFDHHLRLHMDEEVYDMDDPEEFNTRVGRLISYQHILNNFEDNDRCLLPDDEHMTLAKLRLAFYARKNWMLKNDIGQKTPYEQYKDRWLQFRDEFFARERRKIQNMPQNSSDETILFFRALARKEEIAKEKIAELKAQGIPAIELPSINFYDIIIQPTRDDYEGPLDPFIPEGFEPPAAALDLTDSRPASPQPLEAGIPEAGLPNAEIPEAENPEAAIPEAEIPEAEMPEAEIPEAGIPEAGIPEGGLPEVPAVEGDHNDHEPEISRLLQNEPEHPDPNAQDANKQRSDSGYSDGGFIEDDAASSTSNNQCDTPLEFEKEHADTAGENAEKAPTDAAPQNPESENLPTNAEDESALLENDDSNKDNSAFYDELEDSLPEYDKEKMNEQLRDFAQKALTDPETVYNALEGSYFHRDETDGYITIVYNKPHLNEESDFEGDFIKLFGGDDVEYETVEVANSGRKRKLEDREKNQRIETRRRLLLSCENLEPLPKVKKLSKKQVDKLKLSLVPAVKEPKWNHFHSLNYQTENGEGEVVRMDYESDEEEDTNEDTQLENKEPIESQGDADLNVSGYHSDQEDHGDHDNHDDQDHHDSPIPCSQDSGVDMDTTVEEIHEERCEAENTVPLVQACEVNQPLPEIIQPQCESGEQRTAEDIETAAFIARLTDPAQAEEVTREREELCRKQREEEWELMGPEERERELSKERVSEWREQMSKKLKNVKEQDFDIHEYGSTIMESLSNEQPKPFSEFIEGKSSSEAVRFFVSSLQLATTMNVELCGVKPGELSNDTLSLKLISKERYHDHLQEYQAPSEETLRERLKRVRAEMKNRAEVQSPPTMINSELPRHKRQKTRTVVQQDSDDDDQPLQVYKTKIVGQENFEQPSTSRQADMKELEILTQQCTKRKSPATKSRNATKLLSPIASSTWTGPSPQKVRILNFDMNQSCQEEVHLFASPEFEDPQALTPDHYNENVAVVDLALSEIAQTPNRSSIDSGFPCDEDFLEQFDQFQQINDPNLQSTPVKQRKQIRIKLVNLNNNM